MDDALTLVALGVLAFVLADVAHEAVGHGLAILAVGATPVVLTTSYFSSSGSLSRWIPAAGGIANVLFACLSVLALRLLPALRPHVRYFLILTIAFNLLFATAYLAYSGIAAFGDWAAVIAGLTPAWLWRILLIAFSAVSYYLSLKLLAIEISPFRASNRAQALARIPRMTLIPYLAAIAVATLAGAFNPLGWITMFTAALPAPAAAFGLTQLDHFFPPLPSASLMQPAGPITRSLGWVAAAAVIAPLFVGVLGPGIKFRPDTPTPIQARSSTR